MRCKVNEGRQRWRILVWPEWLGGLSCFWSWWWTLEIQILLTEWLSHLFVWHKNVILFIPELLYWVFCMCCDTGLMKKFCPLPVLAGSSVLSPLLKRWTLEIHQYLVQGSSCTVNKLIILNNVKVFSPTLKGNREVVYPFYYKPSSRRSSPVIWCYYRNVNVMLLFCR